MAMPIVKSGYHVIVMIMMMVIHSDDTICYLFCAGVDDLDSYSDLCKFIHTVSQSGTVSKFVIHARKCLLNGLTTKQNRDVPPLRYHVGE
jgi:hypothetical protein